ncbi:hypothetical protein J8L85_07825 [Maribacter sp. MMG018]|uniref:hypothetical protein n=1 Tax=Maribacter sp. MMG018 TaxID=2822688 RepID=UPI001B39A355|nr:hypothetical protein [Maribacter sp. MMG018]MBQ4914338.1 hypothetical protein [Maribacter sp. MMG018]
MEKQYCKVGSVTPITAKADAVTMLEYQYQNFLDKASNIEHTNTKLGDFFEQKAKKLQKALESLV